MKCAAQVHIEHGIEVRLRHFLQGRCADVAGVVDEDVDPAEVVQCGLNNGVAALGGCH